MIDTFIDINYTIPQSSLKVRFVEYAKRPKKIQIYIRCYWLNPLGRAKPFFTVLQISEPQILSPAPNSLAPLPPQELSSCRPFLVSYLCNSSRYWKNSKYSIAYSQWAYPANSWASRVSSPGYLENFSLEIQFTNTSKSSTFSRQIPKPAIQSPWTGLFLHHRCRYDSFDCLWTSRVHQDGLQPQIPWEAFLRSPYFQRRPLWTFTGDGAKSWQCLSNHWSMELFRTYHREIAKHNHLIQNPHSAGCVILQQRYHPLIRRETCRICHCCQNAQTAKVTDSLCQLPRIYKRLGSSRVYISSSQFQKRTSFYRHKAPQAPGTRRGTKKPFYLQRLCLPQGLGYQLRPYPRSGLAILLQQRLSRTSASGIQELFLHGSNSNQEFLGKCRLHGDNPLGIRSGFGLSKLVPAGRSSRLEYLNPSQRTLVASSRVGQNCQPQYSTTSQTVSATRFIFQDSKSNFKGQAFNLSQFANMLYSCSDDECQKNSVFSRFSGRY